MKTRLVDLTGVKAKDIICSIVIAPNRKCVRTLDDNNGNSINIHKLKVERSLNSGKIWILCLYNQNSEENKHIFHLDYNKVKARIWSDN